MTAAPKPGGPAVLVAGIGNIFQRDDGFGVATVQHLARRGPGALPAETELMDVGIRGLHLAYRLLDGWDTLVLVDAVHRDGPPGTLYTIDAGRPSGHDDEGAGPAGPLDGHAMDPAAVLRLVRGLHASVGGTLPDHLYIVGCEPGDVGDGLGLSPPVAAAVDPAADLVADLARRAAHTATRS
ncbi:hydrogenase maturation protease [Streptomyces sp. FXJ1.172]|uniref:hydrogenase maturation protease n=1 Tax=Streptomyces sp. FXJ1.172 TaxID=710705 RepID=UPI0007CF2898|nr:hydrogenase maturation protease [Streptomyces sp. FXJ1.172]WEO93513.1 hydrogenase maturation protease [Streptomyces sp. FXJ1.172]